MEQRLVAMQGYGYRELDEALGLTDDLEAVIDKHQMGKNTQQKLTALLRQSVYGQLPKSVMIFS